MTQLDFIMLLCAANFFMLMVLFSWVIHLRSLLRMALTALNVNWQWREDDDDE